MTPEQMEIAINYLANQLPEDKLAEFDALMGGDAPIAQDSSPAAKQRREWFGLGSAGRNAVRKSRRQSATQDAANARGFSDRFPNANRLK